jgi:hypothetical protein
MLRVQLTALATSFMSISPQPPVMPISFHVQVLDQSSDGNTAYQWFYDYANQREKKIFTTDNGLQTTIYLYHNVTGCEEHNGCLTEYNFSPKMQCTGVNVSNTMDVLFGWLTDDQFTHQKATFLKHDNDHGCDLWQHNSKPIYPITANQTACVRTSNGFFSPIYMHFYEKGAPLSSAENKTFSNFKLVKSFAPGFFTPPSPCPVQSSA